MIYKFVAGLGMSITVSCALIGMFFIACIIQGRTIIVTAVHDNAQLCDYASVYRKADLKMVGC